MSFLFVRRTRLCFRRRQPATSANDLMDRDLMSYNTRTRRRRRPEGELKQKTDAFIIHPTARRIKYTRIYARVGRHRPYFTTMRPNRIGVHCFSLHNTLLRCCCYYHYYYYYTLRKCLRNIHTCVRA